MRGREREGEREREREKERERETEKPACTPGKMAEREDCKRGSEVKERGRG